VVWCNVRVPARGLYEHAGFEAMGEPFDVDPIGPHIVMIRRVGPNAPG
jgi:predicted GNAT family N-acyltransferase